MLKKKFFLILITPFVFILFSVPVFADVIQSDMSSYNNSQLSNTMYTPGIKLTGTLTKIQFKSNYTNSPKTISFGKSATPYNITFDMPSFVDREFTNKANWIGNNTYEVSGLNIPFNNEYIIFNFYQDYHFYGTATNNKVFSNSQWGSEGSPNIYDTVNIGDLAFTLTGVDIAPINNVDFIYPTDATSLLNDFTTWKTKFTTETGGSFEVKIDYFDLSNPDIIYTDGSGISLANPTTDFELDIAKSNLLKSGHTYQATANLINTTTQQSLATKTIQFIAGYGLFDNSTLPLPPPTSTSTSLNINCDESSGFFQNSLCHLAIYLFLPSQDILNNFYTLWNDIKYKPPEGYIVSAIDDYNNFGNSSSTMFSLEQIPAIDNNVFNPFKTGLSFLLWFSFGIFIIKRIGHEQI